MTIQQDMMNAFTLEQLQEFDRQHHVHPFTDPETLKQAPPFLIDSAEGCYVSGQNIKLLDAMAGLGCVNIGYGRKELAEVASHVMNKLSYYHSFSAVSNPYAAALSAKIADIAPEGMNKIFISNSGSEAVETALKLVSLYWQRKGQPNRQTIITRDYAYHGSTIATAALNGNKEMGSQFGYGSNDHIVHAKAPYWYREGGDMSPDEFGVAAAQSVEQCILDAGPENVAAFIGEPVQGTMGIIVPPQSYWPEVERICRKYDVLIIADEVVSGFGRTGKWFGQEAFGFTADIMTLAKGLSSSYVPVSATVVSDDVASIIEDGSGLLQHGFTTSGHPVTCAVALKNLQLIEHEGMVEAIAVEKGPYLADRLNVALGDHPLVGEIRTSGLMVGIELTKNKATREQYPLELGICNHVSQSALMRGLIVRATGNVVVLCPPFVISNAEIDFVASILLEACNEVYAAIQQV
ncbi:aminotransferase [Kordiimonas aquimaris]|uniref:aminotransferase n=1 Tax=Kordiimonas aquimaris TaxID=707591 RepID=UPI0021CE53F5|nr:aminotransferase [Kordiimonas aquimaris]